MKSKTQKPRIRLSRHIGYFVCIGLGATGCGCSMRDAWDAWTIEMFLKGKKDKIPQ